MQCILNELRIVTIVRFKTDRATDNVFLNDNNLADESCFVYNRECKTLKYNREGIQVL